MAQQQKQTLKERLDSIPKRIDSILEHAKAGNNVAQNLERQDFIIQRMLLNSDLFRLKSSLRNDLSKAKPSDKLPKKSF